VAAWISGGLVVRNLLICMIAKGLTPFSGAEVFVIMKKSRF